MSPEQFAEARKIVADAADNDAKHEANGDNESLKAYEIFEDVKLELGERAVALLAQLLETAGPA